MAMAPSISYSMTVRLEVGSRGRAVSEITRAVEHAGGIVTALDVNAAGHERLRVGMIDDFATAAGADLTPFPPCRACWCSDDVGHG